MTEIFPNQGREVDIQIQEAQRPPKRLNPGRIIPGCIIKLSKIKNEERTLNAAKERT